MQAEEECTLFFSFNPKNIFVYVRVDFRTQFCILKIIISDNPLSEKETKNKSMELQKKLSIYIEWKKGNPGRGS